MRNLIIAHTPPTIPYPPYLNITREDNGDVTVTVRSPPGPGEFSDQACGPTSAFRMSADEWAVIAKAIAEDR